MVAAFRDSAGARTLRPWRQPGPCRSDPAARVSAALVPATRRPAAPKAKRDPRRRSDTRRIRRSETGGSWRFGLFVRAAFEAVEILVETGAELFGKRRTPASPVVCETPRSCRTSLAFTPLPKSVRAESCVVPLPPPPGLDPPPPPPLGLIRLDCSKSSITSVSAPIAGFPVSGRERMPTVSSITIETACSRRSSLPKLA